MSGCEDILLAALRGRPLTDPQAEHVAGCAICAESVAGAGALSRALSDEPPPPPGLGERVLRAVDPVLAAHRDVALRTGTAGRAPTPWPQAMTIDWRRLAAALLPALLVLPLVVAADVLLLRAAHAVLGTLLPGSLTTYLVGSYAALLAVLVAATFAAIPFLVQHQASPWKEGHV